MGRATVRLREDPLMMAGQVVSPAGTKTVLYSSEGEGRASVHGVVYEGGAAIIVDEYGKRTGIPLDRVVSIVFDPERRSW